MSIDGAVFAMADQDINEAAFDPDEDGAATATATMKKPAPPQRKAKKLPPYKVLLHNDDVNTFEHVHKAIVRLTTITPQQALLRVLEAHESGVALLLVTHRERAELYVDQFASLSLTVTIEPDEG